MGSGDGARADEARTDDAPPRSAAQSNVLAVVLLVGLVVVGALLVAAAGSALLDGVQSESQEEVARDAAATTRGAVAEVLATGQSRRLPAADAADVRVEDTGRLRVEMVDRASGRVCGRSLSVPLGAVVHEVGEGTVVYEGGAIWSVGEGGVPSVERPPPIASGGERPRIGVHSVSAGGGEAAADPTVRANRSGTRETARAADALLRTCPRSGHDDLRLTVTSPYAAGWERALADRLEGEDVRVVRNGTTVRALLPNATDDAAATGPRVANVRVPDRTITPEEPLDVVVTVASDAASARDATLELALPGTPERATADVELAPGERATVPLRLENHQLDRRLDRGSVVEYVVRLDPGETGGDGSPPGGRGTPADPSESPADGSAGDAPNSTVTGSFVYAEETADLHLRGARPIRGDGAGLGVRATLRNLGDRNGTTDVRLAFEDASLADADVAVADVLVPGGRRATATIPVDAGALPPGEHDYRIEAAGETVRGTILVRAGDDRDGTRVGDLRVASIDPVASAVAPDEPFAVEVTLENPGSTSASGTVGLDVAGLDLATAGGTAGDVDGSDAVRRDVTVAGRATETVRVEVPASAVGRLRAGELHDYEVRVRQSGARLGRNGSVYLGRGGDAPRVLGVSHETESGDADSGGSGSGGTDSGGTGSGDAGGAGSGDADPGSTDAGETLTIRAALANRGQVAASEPVRFRLRDAETGETVVSESSSAVELPRGATTAVEASIPAARLSGTYEYEVGFGADAANGTVELSGLRERDDGLASSVAGEGTVTVLGTEVSYEQRVAAGTWEKYWAPVSVAVRAERSGADGREEVGSTLHQLENPAASDAVDPRNLNAPGTQATPVGWRWEQSAGEEVHLTLRSRLWQRAIYGYERAGERTGDGPAYEDRTYRDFRPPASAWDRPDVSVDASAGENPANVRVLRDGDRVPEVRRGYPDQRNVSQVLDQGARHRIDPETGELDLGPNEAVFLFELTDDRSYPEGTWRAAKAREGPGDPNFNDVVALVEFEASGTNASLDAALSVDDDARGLTVSLPTAGGGNGSVSGGEPAVETGPVEGTADPDPPTVGDSTGGETRVQVDVGHVVVG